MQNNYVKNIQESELMNTDRVILDNAKAILAEQVSRLERQNENNPAQRTPEWFKLRENLITASMVAPILGINKFEDRLKTLRKKLGLEPGFQGNFYTNWGNDFEDTACYIYSKLFNKVVNEFGLLLHQEHDFLGASPDGITKEGTMIEIKCPPSRYITGIVPDYYLAQMQLQLEVCNLEVCHFVECKFVKYENREAYLADTDFYTEINSSDEPEIFEDVHCSSVLADDGTSLFKGQRPKSQYEIDRETDAGISLENIDPMAYWKLERMSVVVVPRDREWFKDALPKFREFHKELVYFKQNPKEFEEKYPSRNKSTVVLDLDTGSLISKEDHLKNKRKKNVKRMLDLL